MVLADRCRRLLLSLDENLRSSNLEGTNAQRAADDVESAIYHVLNKVQTWASLSRVRSILQQSSIKQGIDESYREIELCVTQFNFSMNIIINGETVKLADAQTRDHAELRELLQSILWDRNEMKTILGLEKPAIEGIMRSIQEELLERERRSPGHQEEQGQDALVQGLWKVHSETKILPPLTDLTGQVVLTSKFPVIPGNYSDIYTGVWLGEERVGLKLPRGITTRADQDRFEREVGIWRHLQHPNIARLYGIAYLDDQHVFMVAPWQQNGTAIDYVRKRPGVDRMRLLNEVASGLEYLHLNKIVHGDLRGANILISESGKALISDFGLSKVIEEVRDSGTSTLTGVTPARWMAPELFKPERFDRVHAVVSTQTDIWSFAMVCLELITRQHPFCEISRDMEIPFKVLEGTRPGRPDGSLMTDGLWDLMEACWKHDPNERPSMTDVRTHMKKLENDPHSLFAGAVIGVPISESPPPLPDVGLPGPADPPPHSLTDRPIPLRSPLQRTSEEDSTQRTLPSNTEMPTRSAGHRYSRRNNPSVDPATGLVGSLPHSPAASEHSTFWQPEDPANVPAGTLADTGKSLVSITRPQQNPDRPGSRPGTARSSSSIGSMSQGQSIESLPSRESLPGIRNGEERRQTGRTPLPVPSSPVSGQSPSSPLLSPSLLRGQAPATLPSVSRSGSTASLSHPHLAPGIASLPENIRNAVNDPGYDVQVAHDDSIAGGTAQGLIEQLLDGSASEGENYRAIFIKTYRLFLMPAELYQLMIDRFRATEFEENRDLPLQHRNATRLAVLSFLKSWLRSHDVDTETDLLEDMRAFVGSIRSHTGTYAPPVAREIVAILSQRLERNSTLLRVSPSPLAVKSVRAKGEDVSARQLAIALTILEGQRYRNIRSSDCVLKFREPPVRNNIDIAYETSMRLHNWVKRSVLRPDYIFSRGSVVGFFFDTAEECEKCHNYSSMAAILNALLSPTIARLDLTCSLGIKNRNGTFKRMARVISDENDYKHYRKAVEDCRKACVPILSVHVSDVQRSCTSGLLVTVDGQDLINYSHCKQLARHVDDMLQFHPPDLDKQHDPAVFAYMEYQLNASPKDTSSDDQFEARSLQLKAKQSKDRTLVALQILGFPERHGTS